ncbi:MAG: hypothetical protein HY986_08010 [Candidatus Melainabacteria bacterium]|nr:hypothetical protein [Candidatus Melainabacteria bacterium]
MEAEAISAKNDISLKAMVIARAVGIVVIAATAFFSRSQGESPLSALLFLLLLPLELVKGKALLHFFIDLTLAAALFAYPNANQAAYLYLLPFSLARLTLSAGGTLPKLGFLICVTAVAGLSLWQSALETTRASGAALLFQMFAGSDCINLLAAATAFYLTALALRSYTQTRNKESLFLELQANPKNQDLQKECVKNSSFDMAFILNACLVAVAASLVLINNLANDMRYRGELITETNMHNVPLALAVALLLPLHRCKNSLVFLVLSALSAFFLTVAASYSFLNGFQLIYFLALARISVLRKGLTGKAAMVFILTGFLLSTQINPAGVFPHATTCSAQLFLLKSFTYPQTMGCLTALLLLSVLGMAGYQEKLLKDQQKQILKLALQSSKQEKADPTA